MEYKNHPISSESSLATEHIGEKIGQRLKGGEVIELVSDLGGGKTTFVRGLARGAGSKDHVSSPTFKINNTYTAGGLKLYHFDFYRLNEAGLVGDELAEVVNQPDIVVVTEWAETLQDVLPKKRLTIELQPADEASRLIKFSCSEGLNYLVEDLC